MVLAPPSTERSQKFVLVLKMMNPLIIFYWERNRRSLFTSETLQEALKPGNSTGSLCKNVQRWYLLSTWHSRENAPIQICHAALNTSKAGIRFYLLAISQASQGDCRGFISMYLSHHQHSSPREPVQSWAVKTVSGGALRCTVCHAWCMPMNFNTHAFQMSTKLCDE